MLQSKNPVWTGLDACDASILQGESVISRALFGLCEDVGPPSLTMPFRGLEKMRNCVGRSSPPFSYAMQNMKIVIVLGV